MFLEKITSPQDLKTLPLSALPTLASEIRELIIETVLNTGGHLASSLGCVELTIALHYVFSAPNDKIIWDVGHQTYAHKIITDRKNIFHTLRQYRGISGFTCPSESKYDAFIAGHSSTAISAALGMCVARDLNNEDYKVIAVIGDGSLTGGITFEALNNAGHLNKDIIVVLNDNDMFISYRIGAIAKMLTRILTVGLLKKFEKRVEAFFRRLHFAGRILLRVAKRFKLLFFPGMLFEEMGFAYIGPVDGHDIKLLIETFKKVKEIFRGPVLIHVLTKKGKGYEPAEKNPTKYHGLPNAEERENMRGKITYSEVLGSVLSDLAKNNPRICTITAAMSEGTGLKIFAQHFPERFFDVGIAEQHAVTFAAGLAANGYKPICAIYSTFLQRAVDQIIHDVCLQNLPVVFAVDRAGIVGEDGATHQGMFDITYLRMIPNITLMAPKDEIEFANMLYTAIEKMSSPVAIRYPRGTTLNLEKEKFFPIKYKEIELYKWEVLKEGISSSPTAISKIIILATGNMVHRCLKVVERLISEGIDNLTLVNARFLKPLDTNLIALLVNEGNARDVKIITVEEGTLLGGFYSSICESVNNLFAMKKITVLPQIYGIGLPDEFIPHGKIEVIRDVYGLSENKLYRRIKEIASIH
jgi:1-deoxy-D-xylulose-5-phosphate synthase